MKDVAAWGFVMITSLIGLAIIGTVCYLAVWGFAHLLGIPMNPGTDFIS